MLLFALHIPKDGAPPAELNPEVIPISYPKNTNNTSISFKDWVMKTRVRLCFNS